MDEIEFKVKIMAVDPTGIPIKENEMILLVTDETKEVMKHERLFIQIGECLYRIDKRGNIKDKI
jgi:hypothetical protein